MVLAEETEVSHLCYKKRRKESSTYFKSEERKVGGFKCQFNLVNGMEVYANNLIPVNMNFLAYLVEN